MPQTTKSFLISSYLGLRVKDTRVSESLIS
nr:MAG TPA: hypothetical protein [Caudoviricetes sp.]